MAQINPELTQGAHQSGQTAQNEIGFVLPFVEWMAPYRDNGSGVLVTGFEDSLEYDITPIDDQFAKVRLTDASAISTILATISVAVPTTIPRIDFPDTLTSITVTVNHAEGIGVDSHPESQMQLIVFGSGRGDISPNSKSQGSASIMPDAQPIIASRYHQNVPAMEYTFYMPSGSSQAQVLTKLTALAGATVAAWPQFNPVAHTIICNGTQVSVSASADTHVLFGGDATNGEIAYNWGGGTSKDVSVVTKAIRISPTIHGIVSIPSVSPATETATASADASTPIIFTIPAITNTQSASKDATASVTIDGGSSVAATTPFATIPTTGLKLYSLNPGPLAYGEVIFQAVVVDFSTLV